MLLDIEREHVRAFSPGAFPLERQNYPVDEFKLSFRSLAIGKGKATDMREGSHHFHDDVAVLACQLIAWLLQVHCKCADNLVGALVLIFRVESHLEELVEAARAFVRGWLVGDHVIHNSDRGNDIVHWHTEV